MSNQQKTVVVLLIVLILLSVGSIFLSTSLSGFKAIGANGQTQVSGASDGNIELTVQEPPMTGAAG